MKLFTICFLAMTSPLMVPAQHVQLLIGTYTHNNKSEGIYVYDVDLGTGEGKQRSSVAAQNPSFLALSANRRYVYATSEHGEGKGAISAFSYDAQQGQLTPLNHQFTQGDGPCHVVTDSKGRYVIASNYSGGSINVFPIGPSGSLGPLVQAIQHEGSGPDPQRQQGPHVHSAFFNGDETQVFVQDLGTDKINIYDFEPTAATNPLMPAALPFIEGTPGGGPRHMTFSGDGRFIYLVQEMAATVLVFQQRGDQWTAIQEAPINADAFEGADGAADIKLSPDGRFLYASNRGDANTLAIFRVDSISGKLSKVGNQSVLGIGPRNFNLSPDGRFLLVANQRSDEVVVFRRDIETGLLSDTGHRMVVASPVCLVFVGQ